MGLNEGKIIITKDQILERVTPLDIFESFTYEKFVLNRPFASDPSFVIHYKGGYYYFADYGKKQIRGDVFDYVKYMTNATSFGEVLNNINSQLNLGLDKGKPVEISAKKREQKPEDVQEEKLFQVKVKRYSKQDLQYWNEYNLSHDDLKSLPDTEIFCVDRLWINKELKYINSGELCFGYLFQGKWWKIYRPYADREKGEMKWLSNVPLQTMYNLEGIKGCKKGIGAKSVKDLLCVKKVYPCVAGVQSENIAAISEDSANFIKENCEEFFLGFDADDAGVEASKKINNLHGWGWINPPRYMLKFDTKDFAGMSKQFGLDSIEYHLKAKGFI